jgi:hypothetical protein
MSWIRLGEYIDLLDKAIPKFSPHHVFVREWSWHDQIDGSRLAVKAATIVAFDRQLNSPENKGSKPFGYCIAIAELMRSAIT